MKVCISHIQMKNDLLMVLRPESYDAALPSLMKQILHAWWNPELRTWFTY